MTLGPGSVPPSEPNNQDHLNTRPTDGVPEGCPPPIEIPRTPLAMFNYYRPDKRTGSFLSITKDKVNGDQDQDGNEGEEDGSVINDDLEINSVGEFEICELTRRLEELQTVHSQLFILVKTESGLTILDVPENAFPRSYAIQALALNNGDLDKLEIVTHCEHNHELDIITGQICDTFPGLIDGFDSLSKFLEERMGYVDEDNISGWLSLLPKPEELVTLNEKAQKNIVLTLEQLVTKVEYPGSSYEAADYLLELPNYSPDDTNTPQEIWLTHISRRNFKAYAGRSVESIKSAQDLIAASRRRSGEICTEALVFYVDYTSYAGNLTVIKNVLHPFLVTEIPELSDQLLASLGDHTLQSVDRIKARHKN